MIKLKALKSEGYIIKDYEYLIGGFIYGTNKVVCMDKAGILRIPGSYNCEEIFGMSKDYLYNLIINR
jgi:hypothetical protein